MYAKDGKHGCFVNHVVQIILCQALHFLQFFWTKYSNWRPNELPEMEDSTSMRNECSLFGYYYCWVYSHLKCMSTLYLHFIIAECSLFFGELSVVWKYVHSIQIWDILYKSGTVWKSVHFIEIWDIDDTFYY
jgi:hypothetical protein